MKKAHKVLYIIATLLELGLLVGTYILNCFTMKKLGINRRVNFISSGWEKTYPIPQMKIIAIVLLLLLSIIAICVYLKRRASLQKTIGNMVIATCLISGTSIAYMLLSSYESMRAYYIICLMLVVAAALQIIKTFVGIRICSGEK